MSADRKTYTIPRADLVRIIRRASAAVPERTRGRLKKAAETTDAVAFGWFHCDGAVCPARQVGYRGQAFQAAFDRAMCERFGMQFGLEKSRARVEVVDD